MKLLFLVTFVLLVLGFIFMNYTNYGYDGFLTRTILTTPTMSSLEARDSFPSGSIPASSIIPPMNATTDITFSSTDNNTAAWTTGTIYFANGTNSGTMDAGNTGNIAATTYVYYDREKLGALQTTTTVSYAAGLNKLLIAIVETGASGKDCKITPTIAAGLTVTNLTVANLDVDDLSAISANLGTITAGSMTGVDIAIGSGNSIFKADSNGIYLGNATFGSAPFRVTPGGSATATDLSISNGTGNSVFKADSNGIYLGNATFASAPFRVNMSGAVTASSMTLTSPTITSPTISSATITGSTVGSGSSYTGNQIAESYIADLSAGKITSGYISANRIDSGTITADMLDVATLSAISANLGTVTAGTLTGMTINSADFNIGGSYSGGINVYSGAEINFFVGSTQYGILQIGGNRFDVTSYKDLYLSSGSGYGTTLDSDDVTMILSSGGDFVVYQGGNARAVIDNNIWTGGDIYANGLKNFLIKHPDGSDRFLRYNSQESPDVVLKIRGESAIGNSGTVDITLPTHFTLVTEKTGLTTVQLTEIGSSRVFLTNTPTNEGFSVGGTFGTKFFWELSAIRKGYLDYPVEFSAVDTPESLPNESALKRVSEKNDGLRK